MAAAAFYKIHSIFIKSCHGKRSPFCLLVDVFQHSERELERIDPRWVSACDSLWLKRRGGALRAGKPWGRGKGRVMAYSVEGAQEVSPTALSSRGRAGI